MKRVASAAAKPAEESPLRVRVGTQDIEAPICATCGTQFPSESEPERCPICEDQRQYVGQGGQSWTRIAELHAGGHRNEMRKLEPGLVGIGTTPAFAIGQRALLIRTESGNLLWDSISLVDDATIGAVDKLGGVQAIAVSHPHYHSAMVSWSKAFGDAPIYVHERVRRWVMRPHENIRYWSGRSCSLFAGLTLHNTGGHFSGFQVLHWPAGAEGSGVLFSGDQPTVAADPSWVSFMYSYPNYIPLGAAEIERIVEVLEPLRYDRLYGAWWGRVVATDAKNVVRRSAKRYLQAIAGVHTKINRQTQVKYEP